MKNITKFCVRNFIFFWLNERFARKTFVSMSTVEVYRVYLMFLNENKNIFPDLVLAECRHFSRKENIIK